MTRPPFNCEKFGFLCAALLALGLMQANTSIAASQADVEGLAAMDAAMYICTTVPGGSAKKVSAKLSKDIAALKTPAAQLRAAKSYQRLYNEQVNAMILLSVKERVEFCQATAN